MKDYRFSIYIKIYSKNVYKLFSLNDVRVIVTTIMECKRKILSISGKSRTLPSRYSCL